MKEKIDPLDFVVMRKYWDCIKECVEGNDIGIYTTNFENKLFH